MRRNPPVPRCSVNHYPRLQGHAPIRRVRGIAALAGIMCLTGASSSFDNPGSAPLGYEMTLLSGPPDPKARPALVQVADNVVSAATRLSVDGQPKLLISAAAEVAGEAVRTISVDVGDLGEFSFGHLPEGWTGVVDQGWATLSGPAIDAERLFARLDLRGLPDLADLAVSLRSEVTSLLDFSAPMEQLPPLRLARALEDVLHFPWQVRPGEAVQMQVASAALTPSGGVWEIAGLEPTALAASGPGADRLTMEIPESLQRGSEIPVKWTDPFGELVVDIPNAEILITGPPAGQTMTPNLRDCTPTGFSDRVICVCGWFPDEKSQQGLLFDGQPLGPPAAASSQSVLIRIPAGTPPGTHSISGDPKQGFPTDNSVNVLVLAVTGRVDQEKLALGEVTPLHLEIQGDTKPLEIVLTNRNPYTVAVTGGVVQTLTTSGGTPNTVSTDVRGISPGQFAIHYKLGEDPCPCAGGGTRTRTVVAEDPPVDVPPPPEPTPDPADPPTQQGDSTRTRPPEGDSTRTGPPKPSLPPVPPAVPVPPEDPPVVPPEEEEEEPCCGFGPDGTLTFPNITDPLVPAGIPVAPRDPAVGGFQVLLHSGAYFHNELDLEVDAVGLPFRFARHYKGDVETVAGGLLGGRWDHSLNKRIVPQASQDAGNGLRRERPQFEAAQLWYFDGQGRGAPYEGPSSEWREVLNFGRAATFRAYVTTFTPHPGDFYEIQRYVLGDPSEHPFIDHPAVDRAHGEAIFYVLRERNGVRYIFNCRGQLILVLHRNDFTSLAGAGVRQPADSVRITLRYDGPLNPLTQNRVLSEVEDPTGKKYAFRTEPIGTAPLDTNIDCAPQRGTLPIPRLSEIQGAGRLLRFAYGSGGSGDPILRSVTDSVEAQVRDSLPQGPNAGHSRTTRYGYDASDRLVSVTSPKEVYGASRPYLINGYDGAGRVTSQIFGDSSSVNAIRTTISYGANAATVRNAKGEETEYALEIIGEFPVVRTQTVRGTGGGPKSNWTTTYRHNTHTQVELIQYPAGNLVRYQFDGQDGPVTQGWIRNAGGTTYLNDLSAGNLLSMTRESGAVGDGLSVTTSMEYEPLFNQIASQTDARGNATSYEYDYTRVGYLGNPLRIKLPDITQPDGTRVTVHPTEYEYNEAGQTTRSSTGGERVMTWDYNAMGYLVTETFPSGATRFFARDQQGRVLRQSGDFEDIRFDLNGFGEVVRETQDPGGFANVTEYRYDRDGALIETRQELKDNFGSEPGTPPAGSPRWLSTRTDLDLIGRVVRETQRSDDGSLEVEYAYDASGRMVRTAQPGPRGTPTEDLYVYDARGLATEIRMAAGSDQEVVRRSTFDPNGNEIRMEEIAVRSPAGTQPGPPRVTLYEYDGLDRLKATTDPLGARTALTLDADGNPIAEWVAEGQGIHLGETDRVFDELGNLVSEGHHVLDESGTVATSQIYLNGFLERVRTVGPGGGVAEYRYDFSGQVDRIVTPGKDTTYTAYDRAGNRTGVRQVEIGERIDSSGITTSVQTSSSVNYEYDALGRVQREWSENHDVRFLYDSFGNPRGTVLADGTADSIRYDGLGRKVAHGAGGRVRTYEYGTDGLPRRMSDGRSSIEWELDVHGRVAEETSTGAGHSVTVRDGLGNPLKVIDANGTAVTSTFNGVGLPLIQTIQTTGMAHPSGTQAVVAPSRIEWFYDVLGRMTEGRSDDVITRVDYDGLGRIILEEQEIDGERYLFQKSYSPDQVSITTTYPDQAGGLEVEHRMDVLGRVESVRAGDDWVAQYTHDGPTRVSGRLYRNGVLTRYSLDDQGRLGRIDVGPVSGAGSTFWSNTVDYGRFGLERIQQTWSPGSVREGQTVTSMAYDSLGQVIRSSTLSVGGPMDLPNSRSRSSQYHEFERGRLVRSAETLFDDLQQTTRYTRADRFTYDPIGRTASVDITIGTDIPSPNQLLGGVTEVTREAQGADDRLDGRKDFQYDQRGNLISDGELYYSYDHQGRLTWVEESHAPGQRGEAVHFLYDALGRRVRSFPLEGPTTTGFVSWSSWAREPTHYLFDGDHVVAEVAPAWSGSPASGLKRRYVLGERPGERVRSEHFGSGTAPRLFYPHESVQSDIGFVTDRNGQPFSMASSTPSAGAGMTIPDDLRFVQGTDARTPYLSWTTRVDGFAGVKYDEMGGTSQIDYRSIRAFADSTAMRNMRENVAATMNDGALALGAASTMMVAGMVGAAAFTSAMTQLTWSGVAASVGLSSAMESLGGAAMAWYMEDPTYGPQTFFRDAGTGALFGLIGGRMTAAGWSVARSMVSEQVIQNALGTAAGVTLRGQGLGQAWSTALAESAVEMVMGVGILSVARGAKGLGVRLGRNAAPRGQGSGVGGNVIHMSGTGRNFQWGFFDGGWRQGRYRTYAVGVKHMKNEIEALLVILEGGTETSKIAARAIRDGRLKVRLYYAEGKGPRGFVQSKKPGYIYLNARYMDRLPDGGGGLQHVAATLVHEAIHSLGGGEIASHVGQAQFMVHLLRKTGALAGSTFLADRAPWLRKHDLKLLWGWWNGRRSGQFDDLIDVIKGAGYGDGGHRIQVNIHYSSRIRAAGGFSKLLGVQPMWATWRALQLDPLGVVGHWD